ncbi:hypothetical protein EDB92DRAFT_1944230 [Lactarius akahatsu]|uniref:F-box domain-containing protein n=1 Tax=Lactarius akahatsu TaxID=416441 RepID=A0AAD4LJ24_9AGAM|nr:hypothetical protein EDB92DRAFT_1944230 [Lactarius akahatsu]
MNLSQENSREYQRQAIDDEIRSLVEEYIRALRTLSHRRNALAPISSLPSEILATIFSFLRLPTSGTSPLGRETDYDLSWLHVTHVCHEWREVALDHPFFWSHVDFTTLTPAGATEILARAKSVPLYLEAYIPDDRRVSTFEKELQVHVSRICHLAIRAEPTRLQGVLKGLVSPAPTLEYLSLSGEKQWRIDGLQFVPVPVTLFDGSTPRLSRLELRYCDISWKSPFLRGLKHLKISRLSADAISRLSFWLDALDEMPQLKTLTLHLASPTTSSFPFDVEPLTSLYLTAFSRHRNGGDVQRVLPYIARHAHGPQDTRPLQSAFIQCDCDSSSKGANILAWPVPDIDVKVQDLPTWSDTALSPRLKLSIRSKEWSSSDIDIEVLRAAMEALPLDSFVMTAQCIYLRYRYSARTRHLSAQFWLPHILKWPFLQRVQLGMSTEQGFITMLLEGNGERGSPLLPSLTELVLEKIELENRWTLRLCDALMRRVEQGVPLEIVDLRACWNGNPAAVPLLSEIVVDVLGPVKNSKENDQIRNMWNPVVCGLNDYNSGVEDDSETDGDE